MTKEQIEKKSACKRIPISAAKRISVDYDFPEVVIFAYDPVSGNQHVTTYGRTLEQCKGVTKAGNFLKKLNRGEKNNDERKN